jgi:hypothetical protein
MRALIILILSLSSMLFVHSQVVINEFLASNMNGIIDEDNEYPDWIEIYNEGTEALDLFGYGLSDDILLPLKWEFPNTNISPGGHLFVFASGKDRKIVPMIFQTIIDLGDQWEYIVPDSDQGTAWRFAGFDASAWGVGPSGFGYGDDDDNTIISTTLSVFVRKEFEIADLASIQQLFLNMDYDDGFVAYINGIEVARENLGAAGQEVPFDQNTGDLLHEATMWEGGMPELFIIPNPQDILVEGTNVLAIQGHNVSLTSSDMSLIPFLTIGRSGNDYMTDVSEYLSFPSGGLHTNFKIGMGGESLYLSNPSGIIIDSVSGTALLNDISFGRQPDGSALWYYFGEPTPGSSNTTPGTAEITIDTVVFSKKGGMYSTGTSILLSSSTADDIYYTLDGSIPTKEDILYSGPISINKNSVIRARVIGTNTLPGPVITNTYITELNHEFPIVCISTDPPNLWDELTGIYAMGPNPGDDPYFGANFWQDWEKAIHLELYDANGVKQIDQGAGMKIFGGWSRALDQKSFALYARKQYGKGSFEYKLFQEKSIDKFESIVLRNSGNDNMRLQFHDGFMTGLTTGMDIDRQAFQPSAVYINGEYWGILNIREKVNEHFIASNHQVDADSVNLLELAGDVIFGSNEDYLELLQYINVNSNLNNDDRYKWMNEKLDMDNYIQYQLTQIYLNNTDWPGNNIKYWNTTNPNSKFRWILFDTDFGFGIWNVGDYSSNTLAFALSVNGPDWPNPPWSTLLFRRMVTNIEFRHEFINQYCDRLNTNFLPSVINHKLDSLKTLFNTEIQYNFERWWGNYQSWSNSIDDKKTFGERRPDYARLHMKSQFGLGNELAISIDVSDKNAGKVKVNTIYPINYPFNGIYFEDVPIKLTATPKPGYKFIRWEGSSNSTNQSIAYDMKAQGNFNAVFAEASAADVSVVINEINYSSADFRDTKDWVEIVNNGLTTIDLENWLLSDTGADSGFFFPSGISLAPGDYLVICRNLGDFRAFNPNVTNSIGNLPFGLSGQGDILRLYDDEGNLMDAVDYYVSSPWPENAVGTGSTIELIDPSLDNTRGENWQAIGVGGTPGKPNFGLVNLEPIEISEKLTSVFECFPNPFVDFTTIQFNVNSPDFYRLEVFDMNGRLIEVLANEYLSQGNYYIDWYGSNNYNEKLKGGVYTIRLSNNTTIETIKLIMLK